MGHARARGDRVGGATGRPLPLVPHGPPAVRPVHTFVRPERAALPFSVGAVVNRICLAGILCAIGLAGYDVGLAGGGVTAAAAAAAATTIVTAGLEQVCGVVGPNRKGGEY